MIQTKIQIHPSWPQKYNSEQNKYIYVTTGSLYNDWQSI